MFYHQNQGVKTNKKPTSNTCKTEKKEIVSCKKYTFQVFNKTYTVLEKKI